MTFSRFSKARLLTSIIRFKSDAKLSLHLLPPNNVQLGQLGNAHATCASSYASLSSLFPLCCRNGLCMCGNGVEHLMPGAGGICFLIVFNFLTHPGRKSMKRY